MTFKNAALIGKSIGRLAGKLSGAGTDVLNAAIPRNIGSAPTSVMKSFGGRFGWPVPGEGVQQPLNLNNFRAQYARNPQPFGVKLAHMNQTNILGLAFELRDHMAKQAAEQSVKRGFAALKGLASNVAGKAAPTLDRGFGAIGKATMKLPESGGLSRMLAGDARSAVGSGGEDLAADQIGLGQQVAKRVGTGAAIGAGGALGAEAPFKAQHNAEVAQQQQHPIRTWIQQHLMGKRPMQAQSYLNPFDV